MNAIAAIAATAARISTLMSLTWISFSGGVAAVELRFAPTYFRDDGAVASR
jgi:hypothetical protein